MRLNVQFNYQLVLMLFWGLLLTIALSFWGGYRLAHWKLLQNEGSLADTWLQYLQGDREQLKDLEQKTSQHLQVFTHYLGRIEADLVRINVLGERLVRLAHLDPQEFSFADNVKMGYKTAENESILPSLKALDTELEIKYSKLNAIHLALETRLGQRDLQLTGEGKPVENSWVSSFFGTRADPYTGRKAWHAGVDIVGKEGAKVKALAGGIVSYADEKGAYGRLVEINHGEGLITRYGHNKELLVQAGQLVKKGQTIALLGSSGRSTAPHVHLEVHKDGQPVNPGRYFADLQKG